jgi:hypothetical protein
MNGMPRRPASDRDAASGVRRAIRVTALALEFVVFAGPRAFAAPRQSMTSPASRARELAMPAPSADPRGASSDSLRQRSSRWEPASTRDVQAGLNFGLVQLALGGFNVASELRYRRLWLEYSHGMDLTLNKLGGFGLTPTERDENLHIRVPFTTGFGVGVTLVDELWLGAEFKAHGYDVNAPGGRTSSYQTYSIGPVLAYKYYIWKGLYADAYGRYWPNVATSLDGGKVALDGANGTVEHTAHDFGLFANVSVGYMFRK